MFGSLLSDSFHPNPPWQDADTLLAERNLKAALEIGLITPAEFFSAWCSLIEREEEEVSCEDAQ